MTYVDTRNVASWLQFEAQVRNLTVMLGDNNFSSFLITPSGVYVFGPTGGVGKLKTSVVDYRNAAVSEAAVGDRWNCWEQGHECKIEKIENTYLGDITICPTRSVFVSAGSAPEIAWGHEVELATKLHPEILRRLMTERHVTSPAKPVDLNVARKPVGKTRSNKICK